MFCTQCGARNLETDQYCRACNAPLVKRTPSGGVQPPPAPYATPSAPPPAQNYPPYPGYQGFPVSQGQPGSFPVREGASGRAIGAMILSLISVFTCGPLFSIPGMIMGKKEMDAIRNGQAPPAGETMAKIGYYVGIVSTVLACLGFLVWIVAFVIAAASGSMQ
ncbi:MAG: DUF4190 domain-containing protein [Blastocatellia bacterium]|nr:DUF4190 domain-containing protein [Blastocatellia bacterium]